jgi:hypothetical protein
MFERERHDSAFRFRSARECSKIRERIDGFSEARRVDRRVLRRLVRLPELILSRT